MSSKLSISEFVALMAALMALNALAIDIMLPALPDVGNALGVTTPNHRQYVVIAYVIGFGFAQPIYGPLSDRFGRKGPLLASLVGYTVFGAACIFAQSFGELIVARAAQGVFAAGSRVISMSIIRDEHAGRGMARIMSLVMMVFMAIPILAPNIGQLILWTATWRWIFAVLAVFSTVLFIWVATRFRETLPPEDRRPMSLLGLARSFGLVLRHRVTFGYMLATGVIFGALFAFISSSEQIYVDVYGKKDTFTFYFAAVAAAMAVASFVNSRLVAKMGMRRLSHMALCAFALINLAYVGLLWAGVDGFVPFFITMGLSFLCFAFIGANFNAMAMEPMGEVAGSASALIGFSTTVLAGAVGGFIGQQFDGSALPLAFGFACLGAISLLIVLTVERGKLFVGE